MVRVVFVALMAPAVVAQDMFLAVRPRTSEPSIPTVTTLGGGQFPMLVMGDGASWGRGTNFTTWLQVAGKGAGIHSAWGYHSQKNIPAAIEAAGAKRSDYYLSSMIPCGKYAGGPEPMNASLAESFIALDLQQLNTTYLDMIFLHHRCRTPEETKEVWSVLEKARQQGVAVDIGVSNFEVADLEMLLAVAKEPIAANQCHFGLGQMDFDTLAFCQKHGITVEAYDTVSNNVVPVSHPTVVAIAAKHNMSTYQVAMRYVSQHGISILTATTNPEHMQEDIAIFSFNLTSDELANLDALQTQKHGCSDCYTIECRTCRFVLDELGCPSGYDIGNPNGTACVKCAAKFNETVINGCSSMAMATKACGA